MSNFAFGSLVVLAFLAVVFVRGKLAHVRLRRESEFAATRSYGVASEIPRLDITYSYGYPAFKVTFHTKLELQVADELGRNKDFKREIDTLCKTHGPKNRPFSAEQAIFFTYEGWLEEQDRKQGDHL